MRTAPSTVAAHRGLIGPGDDRVMVPAEHALVAVAVLCAAALVGALAVASRRVDHWPVRRGSVRRGARLPALAAALALLIAASAVVVLARIGQLDGVLHRIEHASVGLAALAVGLEALSFAGYVTLSSTWLPAAPGLWGYLRLRQTVAAWRETAPGSPDKSASPRAVRRPRVKRILPTRDQIGHRSRLAVARDCRSSNSTPGR